MRDDGEGPSKRDNRNMQRTIPAYAVLAAGTTLLCTGSAAVKGTRNNRRLIVLIMCVSDQHQTVGSQGAPPLLLLIPRHSLLLRLGVCAHAGTGVATRPP